MFVLYLVHYIFFIIHMLKSLLVQSIFESTFTAKVFYDDKWGSVVLNLNQLFENVINSMNLQSLFAIIAHI